ncbi:MAG TPA: SprT family zinc-dependent metalloprotease [Clostridia bacterium]|nr:SprT family zinc-dependent metalloprotease [Clostridia bacterium]
MNTFKLPKETKKITIDLGYPIGTRIVIWNQGRYRNMSLRVDKDGSIYLNSPFRMPEFEIMGFIKRKESWLKKHIIASKERELGDGVKGKEIRYFGRLLPLELIKSPYNKLVFTSECVKYYCTNLSDSEYRNKVFSKLWKNKALEVFTEKTVDIFKILFGNTRPIPDIKIRRMKTMWGNCKPTKNVVTFNESLLKADEEVMNYLILHELAHLVYARHDKAFYNFIETYMPSYRKVRTRLKHISIDPVEV